MNNAWERALAYRAGDGLALALLLGAGMAGATEPAWPQVDIDARIHVESRTIGGDGVTRTVQFDEWWMRRGKQVWTQRIMPPSAPAAEHGGGHKHFNPLEGGRLVDVEQNKPQLSYVMAHDKAVVSVPQAEYGNVGFDGSWERAYYLLTQTEFSRLRPSSRASPQADTRWYEGGRQGNYERVLWDARRSVPLVIESGNAAGNRWQRITVTPSATLQRELPWSKTQGYEQRRYADYLD